MLKKLLYVVSLCLLISTIGFIRSSEAASTSEWVNNNAYVTKEVSQLLKDRAGFSAYISMNTETSMNPKNLTNFTITEKTSEYFIGHFYTSNVEVLVTKGGVVVAYSPKSIEHAYLSNDGHKEYVKNAVKIFIGPTVEQVNYINFSSLESNRAWTTHSYFKQEVQIPADAKIQAIGYSWSNAYGIDEEYYGTILPASLQAGKTHTLDYYGQYIDDIQVFDNASDDMIVFYTSNEEIITSYKEKSSAYILSNKFKVSATGEPQKQLDTIKIFADSFDMKPGSLQTADVSGFYTDKSEQLIPSSDIEWSTSNRNVATVSNGRIHAISKGNATIVAAYKGKTALLQLKVHDFKTQPAKFNQPLNKKWTVTMNSAVNPSSVTDSTIMIIDMNGEPFPARYSVSDKTITVTPKVNYESGALYTLWVRDIKSLNGKTLHQQTKMDFTVR